MFTKFSLTVISILMIISLAGCSASTPSNSSQNNRNDEIQGEETGTYTETSSTSSYQMLPVISGKVASLKLDANADGTTQQLKMGEVMAITLESNITTGFSWFATVSNPDVLTQIGEPEYVEQGEKTDTQVLGAPGNETFMFQGSATGSATLTLDYKQGWEQDVAPEKTITITVEVK